MRPWQLAVWLIVLVAQAAMAKPNSYTYTPTAAVSQATVIARVRMLSDKATVRFESDRTVVDIDESFAALLEKVLTTTGKIEIADEKGEVFVPRWSQVRTSFEDYGNVVHLSLVPDQVEEFETWTASRVDTVLSIRLDGHLLVEPKLMTAISDGEIQLTGNFSNDELQYLKVLLTNDSLKPPLEPL